MKFSLFHKKKEQQEAETPAAPQEKPQQAEATIPEQPKQEAATVLELTSMQQTVVTSPEEKKPEAAEAQSKTYLKAMPLKTIADVENVKNEVKNGNIIILRVTPLASKSIDDVKNAVNQLTEFAEQVGGDIARLGEERVVVCPKNIRIWREKSPGPAETLPTAAPTAA